VDEDGTRRYVVLDLWRRIGVDEEEKRWSEAWCGDLCMRERERESIKVLGWVDRVAAATTCECEYC